MNGISSPLVNGPIFCAVRHVLRIDYCRESPSLEKERRMTVNMRSVRLGRIVIPGVSAVCRAKCRSPTEETAIIIGVIPGPISVPGVVVRYKRAAVRSLHAPPCLRPIRVCVVVNFGSPAPPHVGIVPGQSVSAVIGDAIVLVIVPVANFTAIKFVCAAGVGPAGVYVVILNECELWATDSGGNFPNAVGTGLSAVVRVEGVNKSRLVSAAISGVIIANVMVNNPEAVGHVDDRSEMGKVEMAMIDAARMPVAAHHVNAARQRARRDSLLKTYAGYALSLPIKLMAG